MIYSLKYKKEISHRLKERAINEGFTISGIASIPGSSRLKLRTDALNRWLSNNYHGEMYWMKDKLEIRSDPRNIWNKAKSAIVLGINYGPESNPLNDLKKIN